MSRYNNSEQFPSRKNPRLKHFDYASANYYFITICTWDKSRIFGMPGKQTAYGKIAEQGLAMITMHFPTVLLDKYVVMPNHVHAIVVLQENDVNLSTVLGQYKAYVTKQIHTIEPERKVWQPSFHDHIIRNQKGYERIWLYIDSNPENWDKDCFYIN